VLHSNLQWCTAIALCVHLVWWGTAQGVEGNPVGSRLVLV